MLSPRQAMFFDNWQRRFGGDRELEIQAIEGGFVSMDARVLILLNASKLEADAHDYGWAVAHVENDDVRGRGLDAVIQPIADLIRARMKRKAAS